MFLTSFQDCLTPAGRTYASHEEAALATGLLTRKDEATKVLEEMDRLHYTGAQLRFAFVLLVEPVHARSWPSLRNS